MSPAVFAKELFKHSEYQSAWVRLIIWVFSAGYIGLGATTGYYEVDLLQYGVLFGSFLFVFLLLLVSVYYHPVSRRRRYLALLTDISAASLAIFLTQEAISPFYLLYIWIFVSYGTRYGKALLKAASLLSTLAYVVVLIALGEWRQYTFEAFFFLLLLVLLPLYQYSLLRKLHQARQEAEQANRARGNFLAAMTHELRTPLIGVIGMARLMESTPLNSEQKEYLHSINASAQLLRALIGDILDFSKIDANKLELEAAPIDLRELVGDVLSTISVAAQEKQIELVCEVDPAIPRELQGDGLRLSQILFNLLGNAIKFTDRGEVILRLRRRLGDERVAQPHILIEVQDSGIGMDQQQLQQVFGMFWQADPSSSRRFGGTGLGTTIVRDLSRLMGGHIDVSSELGQGSCFSVRLPLLPPQSGRMGVASPLLAGRKLLLIEANTAARQAHLAAVQELGMQGRGVASVAEISELAEQDWDLVLLADSLEGIDLPGSIEAIDRLCGDSVPIVHVGYRGRLLELPSRISQSMLKPFLSGQLAKVALELLRGNADRQQQAAALPFAGARAAESGIRILLAEDNAIAAKVLFTLLQQKGHRVCIARDGQEALELLQTEQFHLAFVDLRMPRMDGFELTRRYRQLESETEHLPILALTANAPEDVLQQCSEVGMDDFLNKPVEPELLDRVIASYVEVPGYV